MLHFRLSTNRLESVRRGTGDLVQGEPVPFSVTETMHTVSASYSRVREKGIPLQMHFPEEDARIGRFRDTAALLNLASECGSLPTDARLGRHWCSEISR